MVITKSKNDISLYVIDPVSLSYDIINFLFSENHVTQKRLTCKLKNASKTGSTKKPYVHYISHE